jgi:23S rRNA pseudouridine1911/1915/1917 synthase
LEIIYRDNQSTVIIDLSNMDNGLKIIYEDNHILVVIKPANLLSQEDHSGDLDLLRLLKEYLKEKYQKPGNVFLGLVHRLDRRVSGLMVYAKTSKAASRISESIRKREFYKEYFALISGAITPEQETLKNYLRKLQTSHGPISEVCSKEESDAKEAILEYRLIKSIVIDDDIISLLEVNLITGRYNQIRVQFSHIGHPLLNDLKYNYQGPTYGDELGLICSGLKFPHPTKKEIMNFKYFPETGIWKKLKE